MYGYHVPISGKTFLQSISDAKNISNINSFQIFVRNPRQLKIVECKEKESQECKKYVKQNKLFLVCHGNYLINSATKDNYEYKIESSLNDLLYAEKIGSIGSVFHVGKHLKLSIEEGITNMYNFISDVILHLQNKNSKSIYILETCSKSGTELLSDIKDLGDFYNRFTIKQKKNLKICIDTCHIFASGYCLDSIQQSNKVIDLIERHIQWKNIILIHLNDSKKECGSNVDRHENLGKGKICYKSVKGLSNFVKYCYNLSIPMILETPYENKKMYETYGEDLKIIRKWING